MTHQHATRYPMELPKRISKILRNGGEKPGSRNYSYKLFFEVLEYGKKISKTSRLDLYGLDLLSEVMAPGIYSPRPHMDSTQTSWEGGRPRPAPEPLTSGSASGTSWRSSVCIRGLSSESGPPGRRGASSNRSSGPSAVSGLTPVSMTTQSWLNLLLSKDCKRQRGRGWCPELGVQLEAESLSEL